MGSLLVRFRLCSFERLLERQFKRTISTASHEAPEGSQYLSLETQYIGVKGNNIHRVALVNDQNGALVDLTVDVDTKNEIIAKGQSKDSRDGIVSVKQASDAVRSHLTSDAILVNLGPHGATSLLGLKEGIDFRSQLSLIDAFTVRCRHCQSMKVPSQKYLKSMGETLMNVNAIGDLSKAASTALLSLRLFKYYLKIKDDTQAWEAMTRRLLTGEASTLTATDPRVEEQIKGSQSFILEAGGNMIENRETSLSVQRSEGRLAISLQRPQLERPLFSIDEKFVFVGRKRQRVGQLALVNEQGRILLSANIKQKKPVFEDGTAINALTQGIQETKSISFFKAIAALKCRLPTNAVLIGLGIEKHIQKLALKRGINFHSAVDLGDIFDSFVCLVCNRSNRPSLDHLSTALLGTKSDGSLHNAVDNARRSIEIYKRYLRVKDDPKALKQLKQRIANTPKPAAPKEELGEMRRPMTYWILPVSHRRDIEPLVDSEWVDR